MKKPNLSINPEKLVLSANELPSETTDKTKIKRRRLSLRSGGKTILGQGSLYKVDLDKATGVLLDSKQIQYMFNVTHMTVYNWRRIKNLPFYTLEGARKPPIRFDEGLTLDWAEHNSRKIVNTDYKEILEKVAM